MQSAPQTAIEGAFSLPNHGRNKILILIALILLFTATLLILLLASFTQTKKTDIRSRAMSNPATISLSSSEKNVTPGQTINIVLALNNPEKRNIAAASLSVTFSKDIFLFEKLLPGNLFLETQSEAKGVNLQYVSGTRIANQYGFVNVTLTASCNDQKCDTAQQSGILAKLQFRARPGVVGSGRFTIDPNSVQLAAVDLCDPTTSSGLAGCSTNIGSIGNPSSITVPVSARKR